MSVRLRVLSTASQGAGCCSADTFGWSGPTDLGIISAIPRLPSRPLSSDVVNEDTYSSRRYSSNHTRSKLIHIHTMSSLANCIFCKIVKG